MTTQIFYSETGYNRTRINFFELVKETKSFYTLMPIGKFNNSNGVNPNRTKIQGESFRVKKTNKRIYEWKGETLKENDNYTYTGA